MVVFTLTPVVRPALVGREALVGELVSSLSSKKQRMGFALYGPRKVGKTSVLFEVKRRLEKSDFVVPVYFSLWDLVDNRLEEFAQKLTVGVLDAYRVRLSLEYRAKQFIGAPAALLRSMLARLRVSVRLRDDLEFLLSLEKRETDLDALVEKVFAVAEELATQTNTRCVLLLDEFPEVMEIKNGSRLGEGVVKKIRSINERLKRVVLCVAGSTRKTMETAVLSPSSAFYRQLIVREVRPLQEKYIQEIFEKNLEKKIAPEGMQKITEFCGGIPFYAQLLGRNLQRLPDGVVALKTVESAIKDLLAEEGALLFKQQFASLSPKERAIVVAMSPEKTSSPAEIAKATGETGVAVRTFLTYLEEKGVVEKQGRGQYALCDSVFALWLSQHA